MVPASNQHSDYYKSQIDVARYLHVLSDQMDDKGDPASALTAIQKVVEIYSELATEDPDAINGSLGMALKKKARLLRDVGRRKEAVDVVQESVDVYRVQAEKKPGTISPDLASALCDLTLHILESCPDQKMRAFASGQETVSLYRQLTVVDPKTYKKELALTLNNLALAFSAMGDIGSAIATTKESVDLYRELTKVDPRAFIHKVADGLFNLSAFLQGAGRTQESLDAIQEATTIHRALANVYPAFTEDFGLSLTTLANRLREAGRMADSLIAGQEASKIYRELAAKQSDGLELDFAESLHDIVLSLDGEGTGPRREDLLRALRETVQLYTRLFKQDPDRIRPHLDSALKLLKQTML